MTSIPCTCFLLSFATFYSYISFYDLLETHSFTCSTISYLVHMGVLLYFSILLKREETLILTFVTCSSLFTSSSLKYPYNVLPFLVFCECLPRMKQIENHLIYSFFIFFFYMSQASEEKSMAERMTFIFHASFLCSLSSWKLSSRLFFLYSILILSINIYFMETTSTNMIMLGCTILSLYNTLHSFASEEYIFCLLDCYNVVLETDLEQKGEGSRILTNEIWVPSTFHWMSSMFHSITIFMLAFYNSVWLEKKVGASEQYEVELISIHSASVAAFLLGMLPTLVQSRWWIRYVISALPLFLSILLSSFDDPSYFVVLLILSSLSVIMSQVVPYKKKILPSQLIWTRSSFFTTLHYLSLFAYFFTRSWTSAFQPTFTLALSNIFHYILATGGISWNALMQNHSYSSYLLIISFVLLFHETFSSVLLFVVSPFHNSSYLIHLVGSIPLFISITTKLFAFAFQSHSFIFHSDVQEDLSYRNGYSVLNMY